MMRQDWIDMDGDLGIVCQCELAGVSRATMYAHRIAGTSTKVWPLETILALGRSPSA